jgi:hypothetical protein
MNEAYQLGSSHVARSAWAYSGLAACGITNRSTGWRITWPNSTHAEQMTVQRTAPPRFAILLLASALTCLSACSNSSDDVQSESPGISPDANADAQRSGNRSALLPYEIIKREVVPINKVVYRVRLDFIDGDRLPSEDELAAISRHLKQRNPEFESVFVYFYMRGYDCEGHPPFACAHHILDGGMKVHIQTQPIPPSKESEEFGLSETERRQLYYELMALDHLALEWDNDDRLESERLRIFKKYGIEKNLYWEITDEGSKKGWPTPRP